MTKFKQLETKVLQWAEQRGIFNPEHGSNYEKQYLKFLTELGELADAILKNNREEIKDAIGDCIVCLINYKHFLGETIDIPEPNEEDKKLTLRMAEVFNFPDFIKFAMRQEDELLGFFYLEEHFGFEYCECLEHAYNEIKDRKGQMINGEFVKQLN